LPERRKSTSASRSGALSWTHALTLWLRRISPDHQEIPMKRLFALLLLASFSTFALTACNTMAGAGKDVQKVGEKVESKAEDCKDAKC
jgi:predicted small secreted protein